MKQRTIDGKTKGEVIHKRARAVSLPNVAGAYLSGGSAPIRIATRPLWSAGGRHDLVYVSSHVHDATFHLGEISEDGNRLLISLNRVRQELPRGKDEGPAYVCSEIQIGPVKWWKLELEGRLVIGKDPLQGLEMRIYGLQCTSGEFLVENSNDEQIVIDCTTVKLRARVAEDCQIRVVDLPPRRKQRRMRDSVSIRLAAPMA